MDPCSAHADSDMKLKRIDAICIFDFEIDLEGSKARTLIARVNSASAENVLRKRFSESFDWLFYRSRWTLEEGPHSPGRHPTLPGFVRIGLKTPTKTARLPGRPLGATISICPELAIGSFVYWNTFEGTYDPFAVKGSLSLFLPEEYLEQVREMVPHMTDLERLYPVVSLMADTEDVATFCTENAAELGRLFTGGMEHEPLDTLRSYISKNLSARDYERFFARWTDSLAVYSSIDEELYERSLLRLVQAYEAAILARRALQTYTSANESLASTYRLWPRFIGIEQRRDRLLRTTSLLVTGLPVQSDEARTLIQNVSSAFHIDTSAAAAKESFSFLEGRFQFAKATALAALALVAFMVSNADRLAKAVRYIIQHF
jgi:hypothetical protein